jgi:hypothetical protein
MGVQPVSGHVIRRRDRITGWKPVPRVAQALEQTLIGRNASACHFQPRLDHMGITRFSTRIRISALSFAALRRFAPSRSSVIHGNPGRTQELDPAGHRTVR